MTSPDDAIREQLQHVIRILRPYAQSKGRFHDPNDVKSALLLANHALESALIELGRLLSR